MNPEKRKKYLEPNTVEEIPRTTVWRLGQRTSHSGSGATEINTPACSASTEQEECVLLQSEQVISNNVYSPDLTDDRQSVSSENSTVISDNEVPNLSDFDNYDLFSNEYHSGSSSDSSSDSEQQNGNSSRFGSESLRRNLSKYDVPLFPNLTTTKADTLLMVMNLAMSHGLTWSAIEDLLKMINLIFGQNVLPETKFMFSKIFGNKDCLTFHFYCTQCQHYLGKYNGRLTGSFNTKQFTCPNTNCGMVHNANELKEGAFFITLSVKDQLEALLEEEVLQNALAAKLQQIDEEVNIPSTQFTDITDGLLYKQKRKELFQKHDISVTINTDGSPVFKSSNVSIWPIQLVVNELPCKLRWDNVVVAGLWFGKGHPDMKLFMQTFVNEFRELSSSNPVNWKSGEVLVKSQVFTVCGCFDSPARSAVQNMTQYNEYISCPWCLHPGVLVEGVVKFVTLQEEVKLRTESKTLKDMQDALHTNSSVNGVKGPSPLINLPGLDFIRGVCPDYMHCVLLGVIRQTTEIFLSSVGQAYYCGSPTDLQRIDARLLKIKPPHSFTRLTRSITQRKFWKASEWKAWLLFYAVPCLYGILEDEYLCHLSLLSNAVFLLLQNVVSADDITKADEMVAEFVVRIELLYGPTEMTFNVHQLCHIAKSVKYLGPLWAHSAFVFEGGNGKLLRLITAAKGVPLQVLNRFVVQKQLWHLFNSNNCSDCEQIVIKENVKKLYELLHTYNRLENCTVLSSGLNMLGRGRVTWLNHCEQEAFLAARGYVPNSVTEYRRIIFNSCMYHSEIYTRAKKSDTTVVKVTSPDNACKFVKISKFIVYSFGGESHCCFFCRELFNPVHGEHAFLPHHVREVCMAPNEHCILLPVSVIEGSCLFINFDTVQYVCRIPNSFERD